MSEPNHEVFAICAASEIAPGDAKAFSLWRIDDTGATRPFPIVIARKNAAEFFSYMNVCPHAGVWLNVGEGRFFDPSGTLFQCGRHGAKFEVDSGLCIEGSCKGASLEPVAVAVIGGDVCVCGIALVEEDFRGHPFDDDDETMEITISPD
jgi:nitrite reductase/ring-hydroxylating ferredoxin subunit